MSERVAFLGLGIMGSRMTANLFKAGFELSLEPHAGARGTVLCAARRRPPRTHPGRGRRRGRGRRDDGRRRPQVERVLLGDDGAAQTARARTLFVDCSTIGRSATRVIGAALAERGLRMIDAPVTGSAPRAQDGTLTIMVGGESADVARGKPVLEAMGTTIVHAGALGDGQMVKLINNAVAATNAAVLGQALAVGARAGVDLDALVEVMRAGSGASTMLELKAAPMREHDYATLFKLDHMIKDVRLCLEEGEAAGAPFPFAALTREIMAAAAGRGHGEDDFAAMIEVIEAEAGVKL